MSRVAAEARVPAEADSHATCICRGRVRRLRPKVRSGVMASVLYFVWPRLGQWYARQPRRGFLYAVPPAILVVGLLALLQGPEVFAPSIAMVTIGLIALDAVWRTASTLIELFGSRSPYAP